MPRAYGQGMADFRVVICGGGIAAVEGLLHLRRLAGDAVDIEVVAPNDELVVVVNLDPHRMHETMLELPLEKFGIGDGEAYEMADLLGGSRYTWRGRRNYVKLDPVERVAHVFRVTRKI